MSARVKTCVQHFDRNLSGADFICSDIHGCFSCLRFALRGVGFHPGKDRLFCVGDLVDRGPESDMAAGLLSQPWFHSVRGNHEDSILQADCARRPVYAGLRGREWFWDVDPRLRTQLVRQLAELPIAIEVETATGLIGLVHADVPRGLSWHEFKRTLLQPRVLACALQGRDRVLNQCQDFVPGLERLYLGHTRVMRPLVLANVCAIETGAAFAAGGDPNGYSAGALTVLDAGVDLAETRDQLFVKTAAEDVFTVTRSCSSFA